VSSATASSNGLDPQKSVFALLAQAMVVKPSAKYGKRFGKRIKCVALLVVKKTWLMCPDKATVRCPSATASSNGLDPQKSVFALLAQAMVVKPSAKYGKRFGKKIRCVGLLVVKKTWLMRPDKAAVRCPGATASSSASTSTKISFWTFGSSNGC
jgi:hypothetical protein